MCSPPPSTAVVNALLENMRAATDNGALPISQFKLVTIGCATDSNNVDAEIAIDYVYNGGDGTKRAFRPLSAFRRISIMAQAEAAAKNASDSATADLAAQANQDSSLLRTGSATGQADPSSLQPVGEARREEQSFQSQLCSKPIRFFGSFRHANWSYLLLLFFPEIRSAFGGLRV